MAQIIGRYEMLHLIGKGGMGRVFLAKDMQTGEQVAVKVLPPEMLEEDPGLLQRLKREGEALRLLNHPNIVKMLDVVEEGAQYSLVLEYVSSGSLADYLREQPKMPIDQALKISLGVADALARAHQLKIIHRDIKPANVLLAKDGTPRLTDFGLARMEKGQDITQTGVMIGSAPYLSPEVINNLAADSRMDIWAFGVMLYEMLAGRRPFEGDHTAALLISILRDPVPDLTKFRPDVPLVLTDLIYRMLEKEPDQRIPSARRVGVELEAILENRDLPQIITVAEVATKPQSRFFGMETSEHPTVKLESGSRPLTAPVTKVVKRRNRWGGWLVATVVLILLGIAGGVALEIGGNSEPPSSQLEILQVDPAAADEILVLMADLEALEAERPNVNRFIFDDVKETIEQGAPNADVGVRAYPQVIDSRERALEVGRANRAAVVVWGNYTDDLIEIEIDLVLLDEGPLPQSVFDELGSVRVRLGNEREESVARVVLSSVALWHAFYGNTYEAASAMVSYEELKDLQDAEIFGVTAGAHVHRHYQTLYNDTEAAIESLSAALRIAPENPMLYHLRAAALDRVGRSSESTQDVNTAIVLSEQQWVIPYVNLANIYVSQGNLEDAINQMTAGIAVKADDWLLFTMRGSFYYLNGQFPEAEADLTQAMALHPKANFPYVLAINLAIREGRIDEVNMMMETVLREFPDPTFGNRIILTAANQPQFGGFYGLLLSGFANLVLRQTDSAIRDIQGALALDRDLPELYLFLGVAYCINQDFESAEAAYSKGIALDADFTVIYLLRADARRRQGDLAGAFEDFTAAQSTPQWANFEDLVANPATADLGCESFFGS